MNLTTALYRSKRLSSRSRVLDENEH